MRLRTAVLVFAGLLVAMPSAWAGAAEEMVQADKAFAALAGKEGAHAAFLAFMTDDALLYEGEHPPIVGKQAAAAYYAALDKAAANPPKLDWSPTSAEASSDGSLGFTRGRWTLSGKKKDGSALALKGYYVTEWRRQKDGSYKFCLDIGGSD